MISPNEFNHTKKSLKEIVAELVSFYNDDKESDSSTCGAEKKLASLEDSDGNKFTLTIALHAEGKSGSYITYESCLPDVY